ncbi:hypothetical protein HN51_071398 [Arachis hypogaea]|uniref:SMP-LTD domain-containing protein n=1 Tax=Arachis hypogaea TaxID=3818 RepID=A0A444YYE6_ARAHY|nr:testis-expressed protein 2 isoform X1 [Arachis ipaensis]XP_025653389.1 testis-expressed protein 2 [Arachis hypogaea]QHO14015.1 uncharacterized protein DS421_15g520490 [Arachis hypogaea]RYR06959.1 hypothetical protein Ahy_B05g074277 [Arachis hypogaea]
MFLVFIFILFLGFFVGVVTVVVAEALGILWIIERLQRRIMKDKDKISAPISLDTSSQNDPNQSPDSTFEKEGVIWVLEQYKVSKIWLEKSAKDHKRKREVLEVSPVKKHGKIKGESLILTEHDGSETAIWLKGCVIEAVSSSSLPSKKWAKRYPIKVENNKSVVYHGSKLLYIYLETSWEKEAWCKALRMASCDQSEKLKWSSQLYEEFHRYIASLNIEYHPFIMRPSAGSSFDALEKSSKPDGSSSRVRQFLRRITKKPPRVGLDSKSAWTSREERKSLDKLRACQDAILATEYMKGSSTPSDLKSCISEKAPSFSSSMCRSRSQSNINIRSDSDADEKYGTDDGTLCWNLLIARLFFDAKGNSQVKKTIQERMQRALANVRTPTYFGEVICTDINMGTTPPYIVAMRVLPMEMNDVCTFEADIEYSGGAVVEIETRLEVGELQNDKGTECSSNAGAAPSDLLEDLSNQLNLGDGVNDSQEPKVDVNGNTDVSKVSRTTSSSFYGSKWKSMLNSLAKHVSQVPLTLAIRIVSLKGTMRLQLKPPPSDNLWYGFTFMPDIDFNLESCVGDHKITNARIALFLVNRLKAAFRETLVLPNSECISISWMLAEKENWIPRTVAPYMWVKQECGHDTSVSNDKTSARMSVDGSGLTPQNQHGAKSIVEPVRKSFSFGRASSSSSPIVLKSSQSFDQLSTPFLETYIMQETEDLKELPASSTQNENRDETREEKTEDITVYQPQTLYSLLIDKQVSPSEQKKIGKREKMFDLRKRMSEKLEEKRRHFVEKMRGP